MKDTDAVWKRDEIDSPCVKMCVIHHETQLCMGCARSLEEIGGWSTMSAEDRRAVMAELPSRKAQTTRRRGGRAARLSST